MSIDKTIRLLEYWKAYSELGQGEEFSDFGIWLSRQEGRGEQQFFSEPFMEDQHTTFGYYFGSMVAFADAWEKLTFRDLPITGFIDFGILNQVKYEENPTKKSIADKSVAEQSTIFESIKRLQKKGLLRDKVDNTDRRVKRVYLTPEGLQVIEEVEQKAFKLSHLLVGDLTASEISAMIELLKKLSSFHERLYHNRSKEEIIETFKL